MRGEVLVPAADFCPTVLQRTSVELPKLHSHELISLR